MIGLALLIGLAFIGYHAQGGAYGGPTIEPGPWLLGGLIPTFVGLAQVPPAGSPRLARRGAALAAPERF